jgi:undecaprenyl-diphosphatase
MTTRSDPTIEILESLRSLDNGTFVAINQTYHAKWIDTFFVTFTDLHEIPWVAALFIGLVLFFGFRKFGKQFLSIFIAMILAVAVSDAFCRRVLKHYVERPRPGQSETFKDSAVVLAPGTGNSFPSNHAANCFAVAVILAAAFPRFRHMFYSFALLVAFSRVFVGVHYPSDVLVGSIVGILFGRVVSVFFAIQFKGSTQEV